MTLTQDDIQSRAIVMAPTVRAVMLVVHDGYRLELYDTESNYHLSVGLSRDDLKLSIEDFERKILTPSLDALRSALPASLTNTGTWE